MSTSGSTDWTLTRDDIITDALMELGAVGIGDTPTADEVTFAARKLNTLIKSLQVDRIYLHTIDTQNFNTVAATATQGLATGTDRVRTAWIRINSEDTPLDIHSKEDYDLIQNKSTQGLPTTLYVDYASDTLYIYPVPDAVYTIYYARTSLLEDFDTSTNNADFPTKALRMLVKGLARDLAPAYRVPMQERVLLSQEFEKAKNEYLAGDTERDGTEIIIPSFIV